MPMVKVSHRTIPRPFAGIVLRQIKGMLMRSLN